MQQKGGQDAECCRVRARRSGPIALPSPPTISAAPRGETLDLQEWRAISTFSLMDLSLREIEPYSQHPDLTGKGGRSLL